MDGLVKIQAVVQGNAGAIGVVGLIRRVGSGTANSREHHHPRATPSGGPGSKSVRSPTLVPEVNPMMVLGRSASLLLVLSLLTSAATAQAECPWVLWSASASASLPVGAWD